MREIHGKEKRNMGRVDVLNKLLESRSHNSLAFFVGKLCISQADFPPTTWYSVPTLAYLNNNFKSHKSGQAFFLFFPLDFQLFQFNETC